MAVSWLRDTVLGLGAGTNAVIPVPASTAVDQLMVIDIWLEDVSLAGSVASGGFTVKYEDTVGGAGIRTVLYKRLTGSDTGNYTVTWGGTSVTRQATVHAFGGVFSVGDPWFGTSDLQTASGTTVVPATSVASCPPGALGVLLMSTDTVGTSTSPAGWTSRYNNNKMAVFTRPQAALGTIAAPTATWSTTAGEINVRLAILLEEPTGLPIDVGLGSLGATGRSVSLGHSINLPNEP